MRIPDTARRLSYQFLCGLPVLTTGLISVRALRLPGLYQSVGVVVFVAIVGALWHLGARNMMAVAVTTARPALAGALFAVPSMLTGLLWIGLGIPAEATAVENLMRYEVLLTASVAITCAFALLKDALVEAEERRYAEVGVAVSTLAGAAYLVWTSVQIGTFVLELRDGHRSPALAELNDVFDALLFAASALTYVATALFARSLGRVGWLGSRAMRAYLGVSAFALVALFARGVAFPDSRTGSPWFASLGFIVGIPAVPWLMPFLLGVVVLRRAGDRPAPDLAS